MKLSNRESPSKRGQKTHRIMVRIIHHTQSSLLLLILQIFGLSVEYNMYNPYCRRIGILRCTISTLVLLEHVLEFLFQYEDQLEFPAELALVIPPEIAPSLVLAHSMASPDLVCTLYGGHPPCPCSLVLYYHGCPTHFCSNSAVVEIGSPLTVLLLLQMFSLWGTSLYS